MKKSPELYQSIRNSLYERSTIILIVMIVMIFGVLTSYLFATSVTERREARRVEINQRYTESLTIYIESRFSSYREVVRSAAGMIHVKGRDNLTQDDWNTFVGIVRTNDAIEQVQGVGLTDVFYPDERSSYQREIDSDYGYQIDLLPKGDREMYTAIRYLAPLDAENRRALGFDMYSEAARNAAMSAARDEAIVALSAPVVAVQDSAKSNQPTSTLMYYPLYSDANIPDTTAERRDKLTGFTYAVLRPADMLDPYADSSDSSYEFAIHDTTDSDDIRLAYATDDFNDQADNMSTSELLVNGRIWQVQLHGRESSLTIFDNPLPYFLFGLSVSSGLAYGTNKLLMNRQNAMRSRHRRQLEQARLDLLALASHQLRTPATGTRQYLSMLIDGYFGSLSPEQQEIAERAHEANERQLNTVDDILYVAKAEANQLHLNHGPVDIVDMLRDIISSNEKHAASKKIKLKLTTVHDQLVSQGDKRYLRMVFENVLSNAIKYSKPKSLVTIRITKSGGYARVSFKDQGVGIKSEDIDHLFVKFKRFDNPLSQSEGGSGLGLYLAKKLIDAHNGDITVKSKPNQGSTFTVALPLRAAADLGKNVVQLTE